MIHLNRIAFSLFLTFGGVACYADVIVSPGTLLNNQLGQTVRPFSQAIDQSGLSTTYISGVTDATSYLAGNATGPPGRPVDNGGNTNVWSTEGSFPGDLPANIDFDLGSYYSLTGFVLWNTAPDTAINGFTLFSATDTSFGTTTNLGSFNASRDAGTPLDAQQFTLTTPSTSRYVRLTITSNHGNSFRISTGEMAFRGAVAVPEPAHLAFLSFSVLSLVFIRLRKPTTPYINRSV